MNMKMMLDSDDLEDGAGFLTVLKMLLEFDDVENDPGF